MTLITKGMGAIIKGKSGKEVFKALEKKIKKISKERKIRIQKQNEEVTKRTGIPFKQMEDPE